MLCIYDTARLMETTVQQIVASDVVIAPVNTLEIPELRKRIYRKEKSGASGVWIPATSRDPYGIVANEATVSREKNVSAVECHCIF